MSKSRNIALMMTKPKNKTTVHDSYFATLLQRHDDNFACNSWYNPTLHVDTNDNTTNIFVLVWSPCM